jgi:hypothetical protein
MSEGNWFRQFDILGLRFLWPSSTYNFVFLAWGVSSVESYPAFADIAFAIFRAFLKRLIHMPWTCKLQCLPKRWTTLSIRRGSSPKDQCVQFDGTVGVSLYFCVWSSEVLVSFYLCSVYWFLSSFRGALFLCSFYIVIIESFFDNLIILPYCVFVVMCSKSVYLQYYYS